MINNECGMIRFWIRKSGFGCSPIRFTYAYWLNLNRDVISLKRWFLRKEVVTDISHFEVQGVYLAKKLLGGGGGVIGVHDLTRNMVRDSG